MTMIYTSSSDNDCEEFPPLVQKMFDDYLKKHETTRRQVYQDIKIPRTSFNRILLGETFAENIRWETIEILIGRFQPDDDFIEKLADVHDCHRQNKKNRIIRETEQEYLEERERKNLD